MANMILSVLVLGLALTLAAAQTKCPNDSRYCTNPYASCVANTCQCNAGYTGNPFLSCVPDSYDTCHIINDVQAYPYNSDVGIEMNLPCRYMASDVTMEKDMGAAGILKCRTRMYGYGWRIKGKVFLIGFDTRIDYELGNTKDYIALGSSGERDSDLDQYSYVQRQRDTHYLQGDTWRKENIDLTRLTNAIGGTNTFGYDSNDNTMKISIPNCGVIMTFRLPDPFLGKDQVHLPGLSLAVSNDESFTKKFKNPEDSQCQTPDTNIQDVQDAVAPGVTPSDALLFKAAAYKRGYAFPGAPKDECEALQGAANQFCSNDASLKDGLESCNFILNSPLFSKCYNGDDDSSGLSVALFQDCLVSACSSNSGLCNSVKTKITNSGCQNEPKVAAFMSRAC